MCVPRRAVTRLKMPWRPEQAQPCCSDFWASGATVGTCQPCPAPQASGDSVDKGSAFPRPPHWTEAGQGDLSVPCLQTVLAWPGR